MQRCSGFRCPVQMPLRSPWRFISTVSKPHKLQTPVAIQFNRHTSVVQHRAFNTVHQWVSESGSWTDLSVVVKRPTGLSVRLSIALPGLQRLHHSARYFGHSSMQRTAGRSLQPSLVSRLVRGIVSLLRRWNSCSCRPLGHLDSQTIAWLSLACESVWTWSCSHAW